LNIGFRSWLGAILLSFAVHATAAFFFIDADEDTKIAGGKAVEIALLGQAAVETFIPSEISDAEILEPDAVSPEAEIEPSVSQALEVNEAKTEVKPVDASNLSALEPSVVTSAVPTTTSSIQTSASSQAQQEREVADTILPAQSENATVVVRPTEIEPIQQAPVTEPVAAPTARPKLQKATEQKPKTARQAKKTAKKKQRAKRKRPKSKRQKLAKKKSGQKGKAKTRKRRGSPNGQKKQRASKRKNTSQRTASASGNASISNYKGKLRRKINRRFRPGRIRGAKRDVIIRFVVSRNGRLSSVRLARSSGSSRLDSAALKAVRRAAPFGVFPRGYKRSSLTVTVPMNVRG